MAYSKSGMLSRYFVTCALLCGCAIDFDLGYQPDSIENPSALKVTGISDVEIELSWDMDDEDTQFIIAYREGETAPPNCQTGVIIDHKEIGNNHSYTIQNLKEETLYSFRVCAVHENFDEVISLGVTSGKSTLQFCQSNHRIGSLADGKNGSGQSADDPYHICTLEQLNEVRNDLQGYYKLRKDIDASLTVSWNNGDGWAPIGDVGTPFEGHFDGNHKTIYQLEINRDEDGQGFFGAIIGAQVKDLNIKDFSIAAPSSREIGGLAGLIADNSTVENISVSGLVNTFSDAGLLGGTISNSNLKDIKFSGQIDIYRNGGGVAGSLTDAELKDCRGKVTLSAFPSFSNYLGGISGTLNSANLIKSCRVFANITGGGSIGGGFGIVYSGANIQNVLITGNVTSPNNSYRVGGVIGTAYSSNISDVGFRGSVTSTDTYQYTGGFVGYTSGTQITRSYAHALVNGYESSSSFAGQIQNGTSISSSFSTGQIIAGDDNSGGLIGWSTNGIIEDTWTSADIVTNHVTNGTQCGSSGGLAGTLRGGRISRSYATGSVTGTDTFCIGSIVGTISTSISSTYTLLEDSFGIGAVSAIRANYVRGIVGAMISQAGHTAEVNSNSRWDSDLTGKTSCAHFHGPGTKIGCNASNQHSGDPTYWLDPNNLPMSQWDFSSPAPVWKSQPGTYPILSWQQEHKVFATSQVVPVESLTSGIEGLDQFCQSRAEAANLSGDFKAVVSTESDPVYQRLGIIGPVYDTNDSLVAHTATEMWNGELESPINRDEFGDTINSTLTAWTASKTLGEWNGDVQGDCTSWTENTAGQNGGIGDITATDSTYLFSGSQNCGSQHRVYCVDQFDSW